MPAFSRRSAARLKECHVDIQFLFNRVIKNFDFSVLCGHRGRAEQNKAFDDGHSQLKFPNSKHNKMPSMAIDVAPYPIDWSDFEKFHELAGFIKATAIEHGIHIKWGGDWKSFQDMPHWELDLNYYSE